MDRPLPELADSVNELLAAASVFCQPPGEWPQWSSRDSRRGSA